MVAPECANPIAEKHLKETLSDFSAMPGSGLALGRREVALARRGMGRRTRAGIEQRDSAIRVGASGATTFVVRSGRFTIPGGSENCERDFPGPSWARLRRELSPKDGDVVIVCGAENEIFAKLGALGAAVTLK